jgi:hypothetical protein
MSVSIKIGPQPPLKIWHGSIDHNDGTNHYFSLTKAGLEYQLAAYCRVYWWDDGPGREDEESVPPLDDADCVNKYFEFCQDEYLVVNEAEVKP